MRSNEGGGSADGDGPRRKRWQAATDLVPNASGEHKIAHSHSASHPRGDRADIVAAAIAAGREGQPTVLAFDSRVNCDVVVGVQRQSAGSAPDERTVEQDRPGIGCLQRPVAGNAEIAAAGQRQEPARGQVLIEQIVRRRIDIKPVAIRGKLGRARVDEIEVRVGEETERRGEVRNRARQRHLAGDEVERRTENVEAGDASGRHAVGEGRALRPAIVQIGEHAVRVERAGKGEIVVVAVRARAGAAEDRAAGDNANIGACERRYPGIAVDEAGNADGAVRIEPFEIGIETCRRLPYGIVEAGEETALHLRGRQPRDVPIATRYSARLPAGLGVPVHRCDVGRIAVVYAGEASGRRRPGDQSGRIGAADAAIVLADEAGDMVGRSRAGNGARGVGIGDHAFVAPDKPPCPVSAARDRASGEGLVEHAIGAGIAKRTQKAADPARAGHIAGGVGPGNIHAERYTGQTADPGQRAGDVAAGGGERDRPVLGDPRQSAGKARARNRRARGNRGDRPSVELSEQGAGSIPAGDAAAGQDQIAERGVLGLAEEADPFFARPVDRQAGDRVVLPVEAAGELDIGRVVIIADRIEPQTAVPARRAGSVDIVREHEALCEQAFRCDALQAIGIEYLVGGGAGAVAAEHAEESRVLDVEAEVRGVEGRQACAALFPCA